MDVFGYGSSRRNPTRRAMQGVKLLEEHGNELHGAGKISRLLDRIVELVADGNLRVSGDEEVHAGKHRKSLPDYLSGYFQGHRI